MDVYELTEAHGRNAGIRAELQKISGVYILWELIEIAPGWNSRKEICMFHTTDEVREKVGTAIKIYAASATEGLNA